MIRTVYSGWIEKLLVPTVIDVFYNRRTKVAVASLCTIHSKYTVFPSQTVLTSKKGIN